MDYRIIIALIILCFPACRTGSKVQPDAGIELAWELMENDPETGQANCVFYFKNTGNKPLNDHEWKLYFSQMGGSIVDGSVDADVDIRHVNGDLYCLSPRNGFRLEPGEELKIAYRKSWRLIKKVEAPAGPYIVLRTEYGSDAVYGIDSFTIRPFPPLDKVFPPGSGIPIPDAAWTYKRNGEYFQEQEIIEAEDCPILPMPVSFISGNGSYVLPEQMRIAYDPEMETEMHYLLDMMEVYFGHRPEPFLYDEGLDFHIRLMSDRPGQEHPESYKLEIDKDSGILIRAGSGAGAFYGIQSLLSLLPPQGWSSVEDNVELKCLSISDTPAFDYRGIMLDISRNYHPPASIKKLMDAMALYKLNKLHLSLTNDEGWRLEIPGLPELTSVGAYRGHTADSKDYLIPAYGSGGLPDENKGMGSGFLSRDVFIELLHYASERHIEIIPEINFPGHARAAIYAMEARYDRLMAEGEEDEALRYRLLDPDDESRYNSAQNFNDNVVCVCQEAPYRFYEKVVDELMGMYREAGLNLKTLHTGGDEVPAGSWSASPLCRSFLESTPALGSASELQGYFGLRILDLLVQRKVQMGGWEEVALERDEKGHWQVNNSFTGDNLSVYVWNSLGNYIDLGNRVANAGIPVVLCNVDNLYFDLAYDHHPAEPGLYWGGYVNTRRALEFAPYNVFASTLTDRYRLPLEIDFSEKEALQAGSRSNILGLQGQIWSETFRETSMLEYYYLPKLLGLAERAWCGEPSWSSLASVEDRLVAMDKDWINFAMRAGNRELVRLESLFGGYNYRIPPPGVLVENGMIKANTTFPGLEIRYTLDGSTPDPESRLYSGPVEAADGAVFRSFTTGGRGSRPVKVLL